MPGPDRGIIDLAFETLTEIVSLDLGLEAKIDYSGNPDSSWQDAIDLQKHLEKPATLKKRAITIAVDLWSNTSNLHKLAQDQRDEIADLQKRLLDSQQTVIDLQRQKLEEKSETVSEMKDVVKAELKLYSSVVNNNIPTPASVLKTSSTAQLRRVVKATVEEEERSRNVVIFGLQENTDQLVENTESLVTETCEQVGEKPRVLSCSRIGLKREGETRPILVTLASSTVAQQLLYRAKGLRDWDKYGRVFIGPDRTPDERVARRAMVQELRKKREEEPGKTFAIKGRSVISK